MTPSEFAAELERVCKIGDPLARVAEGARVFGKRWFGMELRLLKAGSDG